MSDSLAFRAILPADEPFLREVYASTRAEEMAMVDWPAAQKEAFLRMQFDAQHRHYQAHFPAASFMIILRDGQAAGRLYLDRAENEFRIIDIALLPAHRGVGCGTRVLAAILEEATRARKPVRIHVERFNRALNLYRRLGFGIAEEGPVYLFLENAPAS